MNDIEMYEGFNATKQQEHEKFLLNMGVINKKDINDSWNKVRHWQKEDWDQIHLEAEELNQELTKALNNQLTPDNKDVQALIHRHYTWVKCFWTPTKDSYLVLAQIYLEHSDFKEFYNQYHPQLTEYLVQGIRIFSAHELT